MYVLAADNNTLTKDTFTCDESNELWLSNNELFYWRKHPDLHVWFRDLFYRKGGYRDSEFNGDSVRLTVEDLSKLEQDIKNNILTSTHSMLYGESYYGEETMVKDLNFIEKARQALADNKVLYYTSSW